MRECEHDMEVSNGQEIPFACERASADGPEPDTWDNADPDRSCRTNPNLCRIRYRNRCGRPARRCGSG